MKTSITILIITLCCIIIGCSVDDKQYFNIPNIEYENGGIEHVGKMDTFVTKNNQYRTTLNVQFYAKEEPDNFNNGFTTISIIQNMNYRLLWQKIDHREWKLIGADDIIYGAPSEYFIKIPMTIDSDSLGCKFKLKIQDKWEAPDIEQFYTTSFIVEKDTINLKPQPILRLNHQYNIGLKNQSKLFEQMMTINNNETTEELIALLKEKRAKEVWIRYIHYLDNDSNFATIE